MLHKKYKGLEVCQGCNKSGSDNPRDNKNSLCSSCDRIFKLGSSKDFESNIEYIRVHDWHNGYNSLEWGDNTLDHLANELLGKLHNPFADTKGSVDFPRRQHLGQNLYSIPVVYAESLKNFFIELNKKINDMKNKKEALDKKCRHAVDDVIKNERQRIFDEGISEGKNLLMQLNKGTLSVSDFENTVKYEQ